MRGRLISREGWLRIQPICKPRKERKANDGDTQFDKNLGCVVGGHVDGAKDSNCTVPMPSVNDSRLNDKAIQRASSKLDSNIQCQVPGSPLLGHWLPIVGHI